jgi:hypothetical protein
MIPETEDATSSPPIKRTKSSKPGKFKHIFIPSVPILCP